MTFRWEDASMPDRLFALRVRRRCHLLRGSGGGRRRHGRRLDRLLPHLGGDPRGRGARFACMTCWSPFGKPMRPARSMTRSSSGCGAASPAATSRRPVHPRRAGRRSRYPPGKARPSRAYRTRRSRTARGRDRRMARGAEGTRSGAAAIPAGDRDGDGCVLAVGPDISCALTRTSDDSSARCFVFRTELTLILDCRMKFTNVQTSGIGSACSCSVTELRGRAAPGRITPGGLAVREPR